VAAIIWFGARLPVQPTYHRVTIREQLRGTVQIACDPLFWQAASLPVITSAAFYAVQSLWVGPFLRDVSGESAADAARLVSVLGLAMVAGNIVIGAVARYVERLGLGLYAFGGVCMLLYLVVQALMLLQV